jgi:hypothetical protein
MELRLQKNIAAELMFPMVDSAAPATFKSGLTVTDTGYYKDGAGSWTALAITDTVTEIATTGMYTLELTAAEMNHDLIMIKMTGSGAADSAIIIRTTPTVADTVQISGDATAADALETMLDGTGGNTFTLKSLVVNNSTGDAVSLTASGANGRGLVITGNATGAGMYVTSPNGIGLHIRGGTTGAEIEGQGSSYAGMRCVNTAGSADGFVAVGDVSGIRAVSNVHGINAQGAIAGMRALGNSTTATGMEISGGATGIGLDINGGATSGVGMTINSTTGDAVQITSGGGNGDAIQLTPNGTGLGINGTLGTVNTLTTLPTIPNNWLTAAGIAADAITAAKVAADVGTEIATAVWSASLTLPGQVAPSNSPTASGALTWMYKLSRNKTTSTSTLISVFDDAGTTVDNKATISDNGTTFTREEFGAGP